MQSYTLKDFIFKRTNLFKLMILLVICGFFFILNIFEEIIFIIILCISVNFIFLFKNNLTTSSFTVTNRINNEFFRNISNIFKEGNLFKSGDEKLDYLIYYSDALTIIFSIYYLNKLH